MNKLVYIVRHGQTEFNKKGVVQGSGVNAGLNETGKIQARKFYEYYKHVKFNAIFTSALIRTQESVLPFIEAGKPYEIIPELNEISWGIFEGKPQSVDQKAFYWQVVNQWMQGNYHAKITEGESAQELQDRLALAAKKIFTDRLPETSLICMHGRAMKAFLCLLLNEPLSKMETFEHTNLCLYVLEYDGSAFKIIKHNSIDHLN